jgi:hypothetical protein
MSMKAPRLKEEEPAALVAATAEIRNGPFSILSEKALDRLVTLFCRVSVDAYRRGVEEGKCQIQKEKK